MADGDDIRGSGNESLPHWPTGMPLWQKVLCLFGYHKPEVRFAGKRTGYYQGEPTQHGTMRLRDQCGRCKSLLNTTITDKPRIEAARAVAEARPLDTGWRL